MSISLICSYSFGGFFYVVHFLSSDFIPHSVVSFCVFRDAAMSSLPEATRSLMQVFNGKLQVFTNEIETVHMVWLEEIQQEAKRMFSRYTVQICISEHCCFCFVSMHFVTVELDLSLCGEN